MRVILEAARSKDLRQFLKGWGSYGGGVTIAFPAGGDVTGSGALPAVGFIGLTQGTDYTDLIAAVTPAGGMAHVGNVGQAAIPSPFNWAFSLSGMPTGILLVLSVTALKSGTLVSQDTKAFRCIQ